MYDLVIKGGIITDGTGSDPFCCDIAVKDKRIVRISRFIQEPSVRIIDASGCHVTPGFIDFHCHSEVQGLKDPYMIHRIGQGITTDLCGNCGIGLFPANEYRKWLYPLNNDVLGHFDDYSWTDFTAYSRLLEGRMGINQAYLVSHAPLRVAVLGPECGRAACKDEIDAMCRLLETALDQGCKGLSSGLYYSPCSSASRDELVALLKTVASRDKLFCVHHRIEGPGIVGSIKEVLELALETGVRLELSHLKIIGKKYGFLLDDIFALIDEYTGKGVRVKFDQYPYHYGSTSLFSLLPAHVLALSRSEQERVLKDESERRIIKDEMLHPDGWESLYPVVGPDDISILALDHTKAYDGLSLTEVGKALGKDPLDAMLDLLSDEDGAAVMIDVTESEDTLRRILAHPLMCFGTDSLYSTPDPHPRSFSASVHLLEDYVLRDHVISFTEAVRKMTGECASRLGLHDMGLIKEGCRADINVLDLKRLHADVKCNQGLEYVIVNGSVAYEKGIYSKTLTGELK
ncbi:MAG: amidohydrolase family protein [Bullifex sp.]